MRFKATKHQPIAGFKRDLNSGAFISTTRSNRPLKVQLKTQEQRLVMLEEQVKLLQVLVNEFKGVTSINKATKSKKGEINA